jgi:hypothetical protein
MPFFLYGIAIGYVLGRYLESSISGQLSTHLLKRTKAINYQIKHQEYDTYVVFNDYGRCFQGTYLNCEAYIKAVSNAAVFMEDEDSEVSSVPIVCADNNPLS